MLQASWRPDRFVISERMAKSTTDITKTVKKRPGQIGTFIGLRLQPGLLSKLDSYRRAQVDLPGRPEAIRRLVEQALDAKPSKKT